MVAMTMTVLQFLMSLMLGLLLYIDPVIGNNLPVQICTTCARTGFGVIPINDTCGALIIRTPNFGRRNYSNNSNCTLVLQSGQDRLVLSLRFSHFQLENSRKCEHDFLCLNGRRLCGCWPDNRTFEYILPQHSKFPLFFQSNNIVTKPGFEIIVTTKLARNPLGSRVGIEETIGRRRRKPHLENGCGPCKNSTRATRRVSSPEDSSEPKYDYSEDYNVERRSSSEFRSESKEYYYSYEAYYWGSNSEFRSEEDSSGGKPYRGRNRRRYKRAPQLPSQTDTTTLTESFTDANQPTIISQEMSVNNEKFTTSNAVVSQMNI